MIEVRCVGINSNRLRFDEFIRLFQMECRKEGMIVWQQINGFYALAIVHR